MRKQFNYVNLEFPEFEREMVNGVRYYKVPDGDEIRKLVSITSIVSNYNKAFFAEWRKKVGEDEANRITKESTSIGTDTHTLTESYLLNETEQPEMGEEPTKLFELLKPYLNKIDNIHCLEQSLCSINLGVAGTVDCIADYEGKLSIIDFKTSKYIKKKEWIEHYFVQCMAYACMLYELKGIKVKQLVILMTCRDGTSKAYVETDLKKYLKLLNKYIRKFVQDA